MQDAAGKVQDAAASNYDYAKSKAADLTSTAQDKAHDAHGQAKVSLIPDTHRYYLWPGASSSVSMRLETAVIQGCCMLISFCHDVVVTVCWLLEHYLTSTNFLSAGHLPQCWRQSI